MCDVKKKGFNGRSFFYDCRNRDDGSSRNRVWSSRRRILTVGKKCAEFLMFDSEVDRHGFGEYEQDRERGVSRDS